MFITKRHISRRTLLKGGLRGMGVAVSLPLLESMLPAAVPLQRTAVPSATRTRLACLEMVHGAAGSSRYGAEKNLWSPAAAGRDFDLTPSALLPLEPYREYLTIVSNTDARNAEAFTLGEVGADHFRTAAVFLTQSKPKMTEGSDIYCGTSLDQLYAQKLGQDTPIPSIQLSIESLEQSGACSYGYACAYTDNISWASPTDPLPMTRDPRMVFEQLFGDGATDKERSERRDSSRSILDWITRDIARLKQKVGAADRRLLTDYLDDVREVERRIQKIEEYNSRGEAREFPTAPVGVPDSWEEHAQIMFDLQVLAFQAGVTRVSAFKLSRDVSQRVWQASGVKTAFHNASHHGTSAQRIEEFGQLNKYHISQIPYFIEKLKNTPDGDGSLLDHTIVLYGSAMGDGNVHNHKRCPLFLAGRGNGALKGNLHFKAEDATPMANVYLTLLHRMGLDVETFGDSTGEVAI